MTTATATTTPPFTANDFRSPLLRVLGTLTNFQPNVKVAAVDTYAEVMALMGITSIDEYGTNEASGQPLVLKWIQWANKNCRKVGLTDAPPKTRGKWMLTVAGVQEAQKAAQAAGAPVNVGKAAMAPMPPAPAAPAHKTASVARVIDLSSYHKDAYVRKLAIDATGCFGKHTSRAGSVCATCPLWGECRNKQIANMGQFAARFAAQDFTVKPAAKPVPATQSASAKPAASSGSRYDLKVFNGAEIILNKAESPCMGCGKPIDPDERCRWVEELPDDDGGGLFHLDCSGGAA